ncbi:TldD/PmbA family protein [Donghicola sp. C2-DW-16]|uniref:TldD/PmbA family protein n=1 Tax=Donghicola mangrovi TaxID=2729614 RepID=A0ABX2PAP7_9RHOB|nr:TldD/PmbA family protein [Donghicola mangrovi]NVO26114.1 TldD/PmbA family protein [Donghicola mangrovi]
MTQRLESLTQQLLEAAKRAGADSADAMAIYGSSTEIDVRQGKLEQAERSEGIDIGLRVMIGKRQANVSASDTSTATIETLAARAVAMANEAPEDPYVGLAEPHQYARDWDLDALELSDPTQEPTAAELQEDARRAEAAAMAQSGVTQVQSAGASYGARNIWIATSNGFSGGYGRTGRSLSCVAIAGEGLKMERDYDGDSRTFQSDLRSPEEIGATAGQRAVERMDARKPPTGAYPVIYDERISSGLIGHLLSAVNGSMIARGSSFLRDDLGRQVLPKALSITENALRPRLTGSRPFDGEGLPTAPRTIVEDGILMGWTLDLATGRKLGMPSTGSAGRSTGSAPSPVVSNVALTQGDKSREELIREMGTGLLVTSLIGSSINATTGDYSRGAAGFWIENGEITYAVNECTLAGNLRDMLMQMTPANDARAYLSRVVPSLLVEGLTIAGA